MKLVRSLVKKVALVAAVAVGKSIATKLVARFGKNAATQPDKKPG